MNANYMKLWKLLLDKNLKRIDLKDIAGISSSTLAKLGKNEFVSMDSLARICFGLGCNISDVMEFKREAER